MRRFTDWAGWSSGATRSGKKRGRKTRNRWSGRKLAFGSRLETLEKRSLLSATVTSIGTNTDHSGAHDLSITVPAAGVPVNDSVIVEVAADPTGGPVTVTDDKGNVYTQDENVTNPGSGLFTTGVETWIFSAPVTTALVAGDHIIVHFPAGGTPSAEAISALGVNGLVLSNKLDDAHSAIGSSTAPNSGATATTHHPDELLIGAIGVQGHSTDSFAAGSGFTAIGRAGTNDGGFLASNVTINPEFQTVSATGAYSATGTIPDRDWGAAIATYVIDTVPVVTQPSNQFNTEGDAVNLQIVASDSDGDPLTYSQTGLPPGLTLNPGSGLITGNVNTLFADHGPYTVNVTATDPAGHLDTKTFTWTVANVIPTVIDHSYGVTEAVLMNLPAPGVLSGAVDPGKEALQAVLDANVSHGVLTLNPDGSFSYTSTAGFHGVDTFTYHATDGLANSNIATVSLNINDATTPVITPIVDQTNNENDTVNLPVIASDSDGDTLLYSATGLPDGLSINSSTGVISGTIAGTAADHAPFNVVVSVTDGVNLETESFTWTVNNVAPVVTANNLTLAEGIPSGVVTVATFTDVGGPEPMGNYTATIDWGDGATTSGAAITESGGTFTVQGSHTYAEESTPDHTPGGLNHYVVTVTIDDNNIFTLVSGTATSDATVSDPPVAADGGFTVAATEGAASGLQTVATFADPGGAELVGDYSATIDWGDGTAATAGTITLDSLTGIFTAQGNHTYSEESGAEHAGSNPYQISVTISHEAATPDATVTSVATVANPPVVATGGFTVTATEGAASSLQTVATFTDPGGPEVVGDYAATIDWGDGTTTTSGVITEVGGTFTVQGSHTYAEESAAEHAGSNPYQITVTVHHENATPDATVTSEAHVVDPEVVATGGFTVSSTEGHSSGLQTVATFTDPGGPEVTGDYSASIDWGDSTSDAGTITEAGGTFTVQGSHTYAEHVSSPIKVTISHESAPNVTVDSVSDVVEDGITATTVAINGFEFTPLADVKLATFTHAGGIESASDFTATIEWGDGLTSAGTVSLAAGVYTVSGSHTYTDEKDFPVKVSIQDVGAGDTASATVNTTATILEELLPGGVRGTADQRWISEVYRDLLNRQVDPEGLSHWGAQLTAGESRDSIVTQIEHTREFADVTVEQLYQRYLHRSADGGGLDFFSAQLEGGKTIEQISAELAGSDEFFSAQGGGTNDGFLNAVYEDALERPIDPTGLAWWNSVLAGGATRTQVVDQILTTQEYRQDVVKLAYEHLLERQADTGGLDAWVASLNSGATDQQMFAGIASSQEYFNKTAP